MQKSLRETLYKCVQICKTLNARLFVYVPATAVDKININNFLELKNCESTNDCVWNSINQF